MLNAAAHQPDFTQELLHKPIRIAINPRWTTPRPKVMIYPSPFFMEGVQDNEEGASRHFRISDDWSISNCGG
jgi:hypothetical protein